jgi:ELWxxDGT repeat protein
LSFLGYIRKRSCLMRFKLAIISVVMAFMSFFVVQANAEIGILKDINIGPGDSFPDELANINGTLFFAADDGGTGVEIWISNSTPGGTRLVLDINAGGNSSPKEFTNLNGTAIFSATDGAGNNGRELWKSNGTPGGTLLVKDINGPAAGASSSPSGLTNVNGTVFFAANDGTNGEELWKSDGTAAGTLMVLDINPALNPPNPPGSSSPSQLTNVNGTLFFAANDGASGVELWKHDPVADTTVLVKDINLAGNSNPTQLTNVNGTLFFVAIDGDGAELWKSDGTLGGTVQVLDINPGAGSSLPSGLTNVGGILFFAAQDDGTTFGRELWKSDGTPGGTVQVQNINPGAASSDPSQLINFNGTLFFAAVDGTNGRELWKSDGTPGGTVLVKDINTAGDSSPRQLTVRNGTFFFAADGGVVLGVARGVELWQSDGTPAGTVLAKDINPGAGDSDPDKLTNVAGVLFFAANDGTRGVEIFVALADGVAIVGSGSGCFVDTAAYDMPTEIHTWILKTFWD